MADLFDIYGVDNAQPKPNVTGASMVVPQRFAPEATTVPQQTPPSPSWGEVALNAVKNLPSSLYNDVAVPTYRALRDHPLETLEAIPRTMVGALDLIPGPPQAPGRKPYGTPEGRAHREENKDMARAVGQDYANAYGNEAAIKDTLANHPGRVLMDATAVTPLAETTLPGKLATVIGKAGEIIDPVNAASKAATGGGKLAETIASNTLGLTTGGGAESVRAAARAGSEGGEAAKAFTGNMRGDVSTQDIVNQAKDAVTQLRQDRASAYKAGMGDLAQDNKPINFDNIDKALLDANKVGSFKGVSVEPEASSVIGKINDTVAEWRGLDPTEYHTPEGIDALKRAIGNIRDATQFGTPERVAADRIYNAVKSEIVKQAPDYAKTMEAYEKASNQINEATRTFSLGEKVSGDTAARKLLSATRNNVQTNYGERARLLDVLAEKDPNLPYSIAGQALNSATPRGLVARLVGTGGGALALSSNPALLLSAPAFIPRVVGEAAYGAGKAAGGASKLAETLGISADKAKNLTRGALQSGRTQDTQENYLLAQALRAAAERRMQGAR